MTPVLIYLALVAGALAVALTAVALARPLTRACPSCLFEVPLTANHCGACGHALR